MSGQSSAKPSPVRGLSSASAENPSNDDPQGETETTDGVQMILRIKRKRGQDPVEALVIQQTERRTKRRSSAFNSASSSKVLSGDEYNAASGAKSQPQQSASRGVFRLAETVSLDSFSDPAAARLLHQRITALSQLNRSEGTASRLVSPLPSSKASTRSGSESPVLKPGTLSAPPGRVSEASSATRVGSFSRSQSSQIGSSRSSIGADTIDASREHSSPRKPSTAANLRFRVIQKDSPGRLRHSGSTGSLRRKLRNEVYKPWNSPRRPPEIRSKKAREAEAVFRRIIDAEAQPLSGSKGFNSRAGQNSRRPKAQADAEMDKLDSRFAEMLGDYLKASNLEPPSDLEQVVAGQKRAHEPTSESDEPDDDADDDDDDDYVYDIYYRDMLPSRTGPAGPAETGLQPAAVPGHERNVSAQSTIPESMSMPRVQGGAVVPPETQPMHPLFPDLESAQAAGFVAQLEGFVDSDDELEVGDDGEGFESYDEGEDEDSNDEGFYRNDYPEEELPDEDDELDLGVGGSDYYDEDDEEDDRYALSDASF